MNEDEQKKQGPLGLRLLEGLSGHALQVAQLLDIDELEKKSGVDFLIEKFQTELRQTELRPRRMQQARELYEAGAQTAHRKHGPVHPQKTCLVPCHARHGHGAQAAGDCARRTAA